MKIFLVAGKSGSGKTEVAKLINEYYVYQKQRCAITSYSKYLKNFAKELDNWDGNENTKPRDFLQKLGDLIRQKDPNYFVSNMIKDIEIYSEYLDVLIIADVRMPEEIDKIRESYDDVYSICMENQFAQSKLTLEQQMHITEIALDNYNDFDFVIANDDLALLKDKVFKFLESIR